MAELNKYILVRPEKRLCDVDGRIGYFHCWEHYMDVVRPGLTYDSHPGGQLSCIHTIVEFDDGKVERVELSKLKFIDETNAFLSGINKFAETGNVYPVTSEELSKILTEKENTK